MSNNLIFVHGWASSPGIWLPIQNVLAVSTSVTNIALPWCATPTVKQDFTDLEEYLEALDQKIAHSGTWVGWSLGGLLATAYALRFPAKVTRLVLIGSAFKFVNDRTWKHAIDERQFIEFYEKFDMDPNSALKWFVALQAQGDKNAALCRKMITRSLPNADKAKKTLLQGLDLLRNLDFRTSIPLIKAPVLWMHGENDQVIPATASKQINSERPDLQTCIFTGCGHAPHISQPLQVCDEFMQRIR